MAEGAMKNWSEQESYDEGYGHGRRVGYEEGMKDFNRNHARIMAQYEAMVKTLANFEMSRAPRVVILEKTSP